MIAVQIQDIKDFMSKLLLGNAFDSFWLSEASITTSVSYTIDGFLHSEFYDTQEAELLQEEGRTYALWRDMKPFCFSVIKGKKTPLSFKIVFMLSKKNTQKLLASSKLSYQLEDIFGLFVNFQFDGQHLTCTTGTSLKTFSLDKSLDRVWDEMILKFFKQQQISCLSV
jgi:hypothetical protein